MNLAEVLERGERSASDAAATLATVELLVRFESLTAPDALEAARLWPVGARRRRPIIAFHPTTACASAPLEHKVCCLVTHFTEPDESRVPRSASTLAH